MADFFYTQDIETKKNVNSFQTMFLFLVGLVFAFSILALFIVHLRLVFDNQSTLGEADLTVSQYRVSGKNPSCIMDMLYVLHQNCAFIDPF